MFIIFTILIFMIAVITTLLLNKKYLFQKEDTSYVMKIGDTVITPKQYQAYLIQKTLLAQSSVIEPEEPFLNQKIDELPAADWILLKVREQIVYDTVVKEEVKKQKISFGDSDKERLEIYLDQQWEQAADAFKENKIDQEIFRTVYESNVYENYLFEKYIADSPIKEQDISASSATVVYFMMNLYGLDGNKFTEEQVKEVRTLAESYVKQLKQTSKRKKSMDDIYRDYSKRLGEELVQNRPLSPTRITSDHEQYTSKIPKFVETLMKAKIGEPFFVQDELFITIGIRQKDKGNETVKKAYSESAKNKALRKKFEESLSEIIEKVEVTVNDTVMKQYSPDSIQLPQKG